jgi:hypothetical protein
MTGVLANLSQSTQINLDGSQNSKKLIFISASSTHLLAAASYLKLLPVGAQVLPVSPQCLESRKEENEG